MAGSREGNAPTGSRFTYERQVSVKEAETLDGLLSCIEEGDTEEIHEVLSNIPEGITSVLNIPSLLVKHRMRTPLMAAASTGDYAKFKAVLEAFNAQFSNKALRDAEMRTQLTNRDRKGMTPIILAARSSNVAVVQALLTEIAQNDVSHVLSMHDHKHMTLLMHAARAGPAPIFRAVQRAMSGSFGGDEEELGRHLMLKSSDDRTILMHATTSGDSTVLKMVFDTCRMAMRPQTLREMLTERDSDGLNLLMHAASCCSLPPVLVPVEPAPDTKTDGDKTGAGSVVGGNSALEGAATLPARADASSTPKDTLLPAASASTSNSPGKVDAAGGRKTISSVDQDAMDAAEEEASARKDVVVVPVFKVAVRFLKGYLWKDEVLNQLTAMDLWGRSVLTHALLSGHDKMFEAAYGAIRDDVDDELVSEMMETNEGEREDAPMIEALARGDTSMRKLYALRAGQVKKDVDQRSKLSSVNAKIESFIPGKLVVMFQLLLPQIAEGRQLILLYIMCCIAPLMKLATLSATADSKHAGVTARSNKLSVLLGAPAMFFWGIGTSTVGTRLGWSPSLSATSMAAATLVIPAVDSFFNSRKASLMGDKLCCREWRFNWQAYFRWRTIRAKETTKTPQNELPSYSTFSKVPTAVASSQGVEEEKSMATTTALMAASAKDETSQGSLDESTRLSEAA